MDDDEFFADLKPTPPLKADPQRLHRLSAHANKERGFNLQYSRFIRRMRIVLPFAALCIIAILFSWNMLRTDSIVPKKPETKDGQDIAKNELLDPRFDSVDDKNQPYSITAKKAVQGDKDSKVILLDQPLADLSLNSGNWLAAKAEQGAYNQDSQRLLLKGNVTLYHDDGYSMQMAELDVDLDKQTAWTQTVVQGQGPMGLLDAKGMQADSKTGTLIFKGPAKLVLYETQGSKKSAEQTEPAAP
jgi:lipopolysaccharide export system protein LptC